MMLRIQFYFWLTLLYLLGQRTIARECKARWNRFERSNQKRRCLQQQYIDDEKYWSIDEQLRTIEEERNRVKAINALVKFGCTNVGEWIPEMSLKLRLHFYVVNDELKYDYVSGINIIDGQRYAIHLESLSMVMVKWGELPFDGQYFVNMDLDIETIRHISEYDRHNPDACASAITL